MTALYSAVLCPAICDIRLFCVAIKFDYVVARYLIDRKLAQLRQLLLCQLSVAPPPLDEYSEIQPDRFDPFHGIKNGKALLPFRGLL
jgi:hypothetical protein